VQDRRQVRASVQELRRRQSRTTLHFLIKRLPKVATEMALHVRAYYLMRVMKMVGVKSLIAALKARGPALLRAPVSLTGLLAASQDG
jgi:hypothetical protein